MTARKLAYTPALDGLRAVGVLFVMALHGAKPFFVPGAFGVDIFFVLSGFLITTILWYEHEKLGRLRLRRFYLRRFIRLYPALLATLAVTMIFGLTLDPDRRGFLIHTIGSALYLSPVTDARYGSPMFHGHMWSLAAEEYFYLVWPLLLILMMRLRLSWKTMAAFMIILGLGMNAVRVYAAFTTGAGLPLYRMGGIAIGCGVAIIIAETDWRGNPILNSLIGVAGIAAAWAMSGPKILESFAPVCIAVGTTGIIYAVCSGRRWWLQRMLELRPVVYIGKVSYELYLWHVPILIAAATYLHVNRVDVWWWVYPIVFVVAAATHHAFAPLQKRLRTLTDRIGADKRVRAEEPVS
ncbi:acyltransferase [Microbacterium sp. NPDC097977]|uniref:acyltransferase family protein n=1 Tax=Microbacterium sp. NPDC097977 TaxID=3155686 RepID=UPI00332DFBDE